MNAVPHTEAEIHVLGSLMHRRDAIHEVTAVLEAGDFHAPRHETIYAAITNLANRGDAVDPITVADELTRTGELAQVGGPVYLADLYAAPPATSNVDYYARIVRKQAVFHRLHTAGIRIAQIGAGEEGDVDEVVEWARGEVDHVSRATARTSWLNDELDDTLEDLEQPTTTVPTPWPDLNHLIGGWAPGRFYVIGARPAIGKSIVAINAATALSSVGAVAFNTLEMSRQEVHHRLLASIAGVPLTRLTEHTLTDLDWQKIANHRGELANLRLAIDDRSAITVTEVASHARTVARKGPLAAVVVDYLQLMSSTARQQENRQQEVAGYSRRLKLLARELACPVIALSQLNRGLEARADKRPTMSDLRESGALEQDADVVLLLHAEEDHPEVMHMGVAKNRHGPTGNVELERNGALAKVTPKRWSPHHAAAEPWTA